MIPISLLISLSYELKAINNIHLTLLNKESLALPQLHTSVIRIPHHIHLSITLPVFDTLSGRPSPVARLQKAHFASFKCNVRARAETTSALRPPFRSQITLLHLKVDWFSEEIKLAQFVIFRVDERLILQNFGVQSNGLGLDSLTLVNFFLAYFIPAGEFSSVKSSSRFGSFFGGIFLRKFLGFIFEFLFVPPTSLILMASQYRLRISFVDARQYRL